MEPHRELNIGIEEYRPDFSAGPAAYFQKALEFSVRFYSDEIQRISSVKFKEVTPELFFLEYIWVVHATGFSAKAVGKFMPKLVSAYGHWNSLAQESLKSVIGRVSQVCNNPAKIKAVHQTAIILNDAIEYDSWETFRDSSLNTTQLISELPYIGNVTCFHLGRNIGLLECVKPDLHLIRMANHWGFKDCIEMCKSLQTGPHEHLPLGIIDLVLWYSASTFGTLEIKRDGDR